MNIQLTADQLGELQLLIHSYHQLSLRALQAGIVSKYTHDCIAQDIADSRHILNCAPLAEFSQLHAA